jgi:hypothetical protein
MMTKNDHQPIVIADAGPLIRLAAAGLLDSVRGLNRCIVLVDRVEDEIVGDASKPFAIEIKAWIESMGPAILHATTAIGTGVAALRQRQRTPEEDAVLKSATRDSGELALREFLGRWHPEESSSAVVVYEDRKLPPLFLGADFPITLMTTRTFVRVLESWGINIHAVEALEAIRDRYDLKPALIAEIDPDMAEDLRPLPLDYDP